MKSKSIRTRLYLSIGAALLLPALLVSLVNLVTFQHAYQEALNERALTVAYSLRQASYARLSQAGLDKLELTGLLQSELQANPGLDYAYISDKRGRILYHNDPAQIGHTRDATFFSQPSFQEPATRLTVSLGQYYESVIPIFQMQQVIGAVHVGVNKQVLVEKLVAMGIQSLVILVIILLVMAYPLYLMLSGTIVTPLAHLTEATVHVAAGDLDRIVPVKQPDEIGVLAQAFNSMTIQLRGLIANLEENVAECSRQLERRSAYLATVADIGAAAAMPDTNQMIRQAVNLIRERFSLYYVGLFMVDPAGEWAVLQAGTGKAGQAMMARGHQLQVGGNSMIGWCIAHGQTRLAPDVSQETIRTPAAELPDTRSEAAVPLRSGGKVIGALSLQSVQRDAFDEAALSALQTTAHQLASALDNARLAAENQAAHKVTQQAYGELSRQRWQEILRHRPAWGYCYMHQNVTPAEDEWPPEMLQAIKTGRNTPGAGTDQATLAIPLRVRNQVIGALYFCRDAEVGRWTTEETALFETLGEQLCLALENARLYEDIEHRVTIERLINASIAQIRGVPTVNGILQRAINELGAAFSASRASIRLEIPRGKPADQSEAQQ